MRSAASIVLASLFAGLASAAAAPAPYDDALVAFAVHDLAKRAESPSSSSYLAQVFGMQTSKCDSVCTVALNDFTEVCQAKTNQATIAACACSSTSLGDLRSCASCISSTTSSKSNATAVVEAYNSFVDLCTNNGLAMVTGTVAVGASTAPISRASASTRAASSAAAATSSSYATYNPSQSPVSTATVPSLVATGVSAASAAASPSATGGAAGLASSLAALVGAGALAGLALLA
ncbi:hypothetical protein JCM10207_000825 [Rhodosporidiobolus poonsookiae]